MEGEAQRRHSGTAPDVAPREGSPLHRPANIAPRPSRRRQRSNSPTEDHPPPPANPSTPAGPAEPTPMYDDSNEQRENGSCGGEADEYEVIALRRENEALRRELDLVRESFQDMQRMYGAKCGELVMLQRSVRWPGSGGGGGYCEPRAQSISSSDYNSQQVTGQHQPYAAYYGGPSPYATMGAHHGSHVPMYGDATGYMQQQQQPMQDYYGGNKYESASLPPFITISTTGTYVSWHCELCHVTVNSEATLISHLQGEKHRRKVSKFSSHPYHQQQQQQPPPPPNDPGAAQQQQQQQQQHQQHIGGGIM